ncbi:MAG: hypothetical protein KCHDKBKB_01856 [Elusimicrobia bacterium]|nr:hypothetical protein [Elusimicrobiota bacterium]
MSVELADRPLWSRSQVDMLKECSRKLALHMKATRDASVDPVYGQAAALKKLKNRHLWTGSFIHEAVGELLKTLRQGNALPSTEGLIENLKDKMRVQYKASREGQGAEGRLREHEYEMKIAPEVWRGHWDTVEKSLRWFTQSNWLKRLSGLGPECWKVVDELLEFDVNGIKAYVKIDCAIETEGKFFLIDWKTSNSITEAEPSLLVAALYAHEVWGAEPEQINACAVSMLTGQTFHATVNEDALINTHLKIEEESTLLEETKRNFPSDPFSLPFPNSSLTCQRCNFQKLCHGLR